MARCGPEHDGFAPALRLHLWPATAPHWAVGWVVQPGPWRPSAYQSVGAAIPRPQRSMVAGLAAEPAKGGERHGAVRATDRRRGGMRQKSSAHQDQRDRGAVQ